MNRCTPNFHIIWKHRDLYAKIVPIMGGFHHLRVFQRVLLKRYNYLGLQDWFVDLGTILAGSISLTFEGRNYYHLICLHEKNLMLFFKVE